MKRNPLKTLADYSRFIAELLNRPTVKRSTVVVWSTSPYTGVMEGEVFFTQGFRLRVREELDFEAGLITSYGYEVIEAKSSCIGMMIFHILMTRFWRQPFPIISIFRLI